MTFYYTLDHSRTGRGAGAIAHKFLRFRQIEIFWAVTRKYLGSDMKNLGKVRNFRAVTMINCKK